jgi:hypothetical protein
MLLAKDIELPAWASRWQAAKKAASSLSEAAEDLF